MAGLFKIPGPTLQRLPRYLRVLRKLARQGQQYVSSSALGSQLNIQEYQVRKDLTHTRSRGRPGKGYLIEELVEALEDLLGLNKVHEAVVVGAGRLGGALSDYPGFARYGMKIVALFDNNPEKIGRSIGGVPVIDTSQMVELLQRMAISLAVLTTPAEVAQDAADDLVSGGVKAIWNFAPEVLDVPPDVYVKNEDLAASLASLSHHVTSIEE